MAEPHHDMTANTQCIIQLPPKDGDMYRTNLNPSTFFSPMNNVTKEESSLIVPK